MAKQIKTFTFLITIKQSFPVCLFRPKCKLVKTKHLGSGHMTENANQNTNDIVNVAIAIKVYCYNFTGSISLHAFEAHSLLAKLQVSGIVIEFPREEARRNSKPFAQVHFDTLTMNVRECNYHTPATATESGAVCHVVED